jgi:periplasmic protein TonB
MIDSTARAPRFEGDSNAPSYIWAPEGKPVTVALPLALIAELERAAVESFRSISSRGSEIGGVLFGSVAPGAPAQVMLASFEPVDCDYAAGPLYRLSDGELSRLDRVLEQRAASGAIAVGFYRSHTRKGLSLDAADLALFDSRFREPHHIALVIRPAAGKASTAGIFIRENGVVHADASCLEFPCRAGAQDAAKTAASLYDGAVAGPRSFAAAPAPPRPVVRAQIVPIASRREATTETPLPAPVAAVPEPPAPEPPKTVEPPKPVETAKTVEPPKPAQTAKGVEPPKPVEPAKAQPEPESEPEPVKAGSSKLLWIAMGAILSVVLCVGFVLSSGMLHRNPTVPTSAQDTSQLALKVDRNGADVVLTWNRDSDAIRKAGRAVLSINDGSQHENVEMDLAQLRNGSIVYTPVTGDVVFKMEVSAAGQAPIASESVRVLRTRPSPMPDGSPAPDQTATAAPKPADQAAAPAPAPEEEKEKPVALAQAMKPFHAESLAQRLRPAAPAEVPDAPAITAKMPAATSVNLGSIVSSQAPLPAPPPTSAMSAPTPSAPAAAPKAQQGGNIVQAQLISRRDPVFPKLARDSGASGVVELVATVGEDGRVKSVQVVKGHPLLRQAAADAVRSWVYRPTLLNGKAIESQTQIFLTFKSDR